MRIVDAHSDFALKVFYDHINGQKDVFKNQHLSDLQKGGVNIEVLTVGGDFDLFPGVNNRDALTVFQIIDVHLQEIAQSQDKCILIEKKSDFQIIEKTEKIGFLLALEGTGMIGRDFSILRNYYRLGLRSIMLTHNERNSLADGCGVKNPKGLTKLGRDFIDIMSDLGIILDVSHISEPSFWDIINTYTKPVIASHSNSRILCNSVRNLTDDQIEAIAEKRGVIGINFFGGFIDKNKNNVNLDRLVDHIDYIRDLVGIDYIGLGPDFLNYVNREFMESIDESSLSVGIDIENISYIDQLKEVTSLPILIEKLYARGYSSEYIRKITGDNFIRVYNEIIK